MQNITPQRFFDITRALCILLGLGLGKDRMPNFIQMLIRKSIRKKKSFLNRLKILLENKNE